MKARTPNQKPSAAAANGRRRGWSRPEKHGPLGGASSKGGRASSKRKRSSPDKVEALGKRESPAMALMARALVAALALAVPLAACGTGETNRQDAVAAEPTLPDPVVVPDF